MNEVFLKYIQTRKPFVTLKWGQSLDAIIGMRDRSNVWINNPSSLIDSHKERAFIDAICCGIGTVLTDNPILQAQFQGRSYGKNPLRVILDSNLRSLAHPKLHIFNATSPTLIFCRKSSTKIKAMKNVEIVAVPLHQKKLSIEEILIQLGKRQITHLEVEGGATLLSSFIGEGFFDKVIAYISPTLLNSNQAISLVSGSSIPSRFGILRLDRIQQIKSDIKLVAYPTKRPLP